MNNTHSLTAFLKQTCLEEGFDDCGISKAHEVDLTHQQAYKEWIALGYHGKMTYLARNEHLRFNPQLLMPGTKSILTVLLNYYPAKQMRLTNNFRVAKYAYGQDYHVLIKQMLEAVVRKTLEQFPAFQYRCFTDSAPIPDLYWAQQAGLGNRGKNTLLIHPQLGSFVFVGHIFLSVPLEYTSMSVPEDFCKDCDRCIRACPTQAIIAPGKINATRCISYQTIENKAAEKDVPPSAFKRFIYGCDICQDVCPHNKQLKPHSVEALQPKAALLEKDRESWDAIQPMDFGELFRGSAVKRVGYKGLCQNIAWLNQSRVK